MIRSLLAFAVLALSISAQAAEVDTAPSFYEINELNAAVFSDGVVSDKMLSVGISTGGCGVSASDFKFDLELVKLEDQSNDAQKKIGQIEMEATLKVKVMKKAVRGLVCAMAINTVQKVNITQLINEKAAALGLVDAGNKFYTIKLTTAPVISYTSISR